MFSRFEPQLHEHARRRWLRLLHRFHHDAQFVELLTVHIAALIMAAEIMMAVPCWSSCMTARVCRGLDQTALDLKALRGP